MRYLANAFSLNMLPSASERIAIETLASADDAREWLLALPFVSAVGHESTADLLTNLLQLPIACSRSTLKLQPGDSLLVAQYSGSRLPEGATSLPEGATITWYAVELLGAVTR